MRGIDIADTGLVEAADTQVETEPSFLFGVLLGTDGVNDPRWEIYSGTDTGGTKKVPATTYDASALGINGVMFPFRAYCPDGIWFNHISGSNYEAVVFYVTLKDLAERRDWF